MKCSKAIYIPEACRPLAKTTAWLAFMLLSFSMDAWASSRKNIVLIIADDLRSDLNCYGVQHMVTPNIDRLAREGVIFERAYVQQPVCTASRASFLTGLRPDSTGSDYPYSIYTVEELFEGDRPSIPRYFMNQGYYVRCLGKIHHGYEEHFTERSLQRWLPQYADKNINKWPKNKRPAYECLDVPDETYQDGYHTAEAIKTLERMAEQDRPFFLGLGLWKPHLPWNAPKKYWDLYDPKKIPLAENPDHPSGSPEYSTDYCNLKKYKLPKSPNHLVVGDLDVARRMKHAYAASVSYMDANVGKVLKALERLKLRQDTIVMLMSDHGWHLGEQDHWGKSTNFENSIRAPLIVSSPSHGGDQRCTALVEYVDIYPTLCELAGCQVPSHLEGNSVVPLLENPLRPWKSAVFSQYPRGYPKAKFEGYSVRGDRYHYIQWRELDGSFKSHELYDHQKDPHEAVNVVAEAEHVATVEIMKAKLDSGWKAALPQGIVNLSENPVAPAFLPWGKEAQFGPHASLKGRNQ